MHDQTISEPGGMQKDVCVYVCESEWPWMLNEWLTCAKHDGRWTNIKTDKLMIEWKKQNPLTLEFFFLFQDSLAVNIWLVSTDFCCSFSSSSSAPRGRIYIRAGIKFIEKKKETRKKNNIADLYFWLLLCALVGELSNVIFSDDFQWDFSFGFVWSLLSLLTN